MGNRLVLFIGFLCWSVWAFGQDIPDKPRSYVLDLAGKLQIEQKINLEQKLRGYTDSTSTEIAVVIIPSTQGTDPYDYAMAIGKKWGVGKKGKDNGVVILIASDDRKIRIVTGRGIEDVLPDGICKRIINRILKPALKRNNYYEGLNEATTEMMLRASGQFTAEPSDGLPAGVVVFLMVFLFLVIINIIRGAKNGGGGSGPRSRGGGMFFPPIFMGGGGYDRGGSSGGGGFDFGGFGGGDFGGGGAGGDF